MESILSRALEWIDDGEVGISSKTIWAVMMGVCNPSKSSAGHDYSHPHDPSDFRRCYLLLQKIPEWKTRLHEVATIFPTWQGLVDNWDELETLLIQELPKERAPLLYDRMKELIKQSGGVH